MTDNLYREEILDHWRYPRNFGKLVKFDKSSKQFNPFCGDEIEIFIKFSPPTRFARSGQKSLLKIKNISFFGKGCAISMAASSILTEYVKGKTEKQLTKFSEKDMLTLLGIEVSETRKKCATLALTAFRSCLCLR